MVGELILDSEFSRARFGVQLEPSEDTAHLGHRISRHTQPVSRLSQYSFGMHAPFFQILEKWGMHTE